MASWAGLMTGITLQYSEQRNPSRRWQTLWHHHRRRYWQESPSASRRRLRHRCRAAGKL